jgi:hypothetical protein
MTASDIHTARNMFSVCRRRRAETSLGELQPAAWGGGRLPTLTDVKAEPEAETDGWGGGGLLTLMTSRPNRTGGMHT